MPIIMHIPVLLGETIELLNLKEGAVVVDATLGDGGHAREILKKIGSKGKLIGLDLDENAIENLKSQKEFRNSFLVNQNFANVGTVLEKLGIEKVDAIVADLGWRADQIENEDYGLSFQKEGPLDMRLGNLSGKITAATIVNNYSEEDLTEIFKSYGEERHSRLVARAIIQQRKIRPLETTKQLAEIISKTIGFKYKKLRINPATRIFQALRIVVNKEMENLEVFLPQALSKLRIGGRLGIITFHSLEDRRVKQFFRANAGGCVCPKESPICVCGKKPLVKIITKKPVVAGEEEVIRNPRARSAKLRVAEKI